MSGRELRRELERAAREREDPVARERSWRVVRAAFAEREQQPHARRRPWAAFVATAVLALAGAAGVAAASAPHSDVGRWVRDVLGVGQPDARPALVRVPGGGRLLVESGGSTWAVAHDGAKRRLGAYDGAAWSPRGLFAVVWRGRELTVVDPLGGVRWSLPSPRPVTVARWAPVDGFLVAYLAGPTLRIVNGNGSGDRRYRAALAGVAPAWRPDATHTLAHMDPRGRIDVTAVDTGVRLWRSAAVRRPIQLSWSASGDRLLVLSPRRLDLLDGRSGRLLVSRRVPAGLEAEHATWAPHGDRVAVVRSDRAARRSDVVVLDAAAGLRERVLFGPAPGGFGAPAWSPAGRRLLLPWPAADQWLFLRPGGDGGVVAVANIARQFAPGVDRPPFPRSVQWCCP